MPHRMVTDQQKNYLNAAQPGARLTRHHVVRKTHPTGSAHLTMVDAFLSTGAVQPLAMVVYRESRDGGAGIKPAPVS
jgi:hypothetical protein